MLSFAKADEEKIHIIANSSNKFLYEEYLIKLVVDSQSISKHRLKRFHCNKSNYLSSRFTRRGDKYVERFENIKTTYLIDKAIEAYTKSIAFAPEGSVQTIYAYMRRATLLCLTKKYNECIEDCDIALRQVYVPDEIKFYFTYLREYICPFKLGDKYFLNKCSSREKILKHLDNTNNLSDRQRRMLSRFMHKIRESLDSIEVRKRKTYLDVLRHPYLNFTTSLFQQSVAIKPKDKLGYKLLATKDIRSGSPMVIEGCIFGATDCRSTYTHCSHCLKKSWNLTPCLYCPLNVYCGDSCRRIAWGEYHQYECEISMNFDKHSTCQHLVAQILRMTLRICSMAGGVNVFYDSIKTIDISKVEDDSDNANIKRLYSLANDVEARISAYRNVYPDLVKDIVRIVHYLAKNTTFFEDCELTDTSTLEVVKEEKAMFIASIMLRNYWILRDYSLPFQTYLKESGDGITTIDNGTVVYSFAPAISSSSTKTNAHIFTLKNNSLLVMAKSKIRQNSEIFVNKGYFEPFMCKCRRERTDVNLDSIDENFQRSCRKSINFEPIIMENNIENRRFLRSELEDLCSVLQQAANSYVTNITQAQSGTRSLTFYWKTLEKIPDKENIDYWP